MHKNSHKYIKSFPNISGTYSKMEPGYPKMFQTWGDPTYFCLVTIIIPKRSVHNIMWERYQFLKTEKKLKKAKKRIPKQPKGEGLNFFHFVTLKLVSAIFYQIFIFLPNGSPSKTVKNIFYFIQKAFFVLEILKFL